MRWNPFRRDPSPRQDPSKTVYDFDHAQLIEAAAQLPWRRVDKDDGTYRYRIAILPDKGKSSLDDFAKEVLARLDTEKHVTLNHSGTLKALAYTARDEELIAAIDRAQGHGTNEPPAHPADDPNRPTGMELKDRGDTTHGDLRR